MYKFCVAVLGSVAKNMPTVCRILFAVKHTQKFLAGTFQAIVCLYSRSRIALATTLDSSFCDK